MTKIGFFGVPKFLNQILVNLATKTKYIGGTLTNVTVKAWGVSISVSHEAVEAIVDVSTDILTGEDNQTNTAAKTVLNSTLEKMSRGGSGSMNEKVIAVSSAVVVERSIKMIPSVLCGACPNLLY